MTITIRPATVEDAAGIFETHRRAIHELCVKDYSAAQLNSWFPETRSADKYVNDIKNAKKTHLVAEIDGKLAGFATFGDGKLAACYTSPDFVRRGVATALFKAAEAESESKGFKKIALSASVTGYDFFRKMGMRHVEETTHRFENGVEVPILRMEKRFF